VARDDADDARAGGQPGERDRGDPGRARRLAEDPFRPGQQPPRVVQLLLGQRDDLAPRGARARPRPPPLCTGWTMRIAEANVVGRSAAWPSRTSAAPDPPPRSPLHRRPCCRPPPKGQGEHVGAPAELRDDLVRGARLALDAIGVDRVDVDEPLLLGEAAAPPGARRRRSRRPRGSRRRRPSPARPFRARRRRGRSRGRPRAGRPAPRTPPPTRPVLPVDAQTTPVAPRSSARETATAIPRSLNDPVGFAPSHFTCSSTPRRSDSLGACSSGVFPSPSVTIRLRGPRLRAAARATRRPRAARRSAPAPRRRARPGRRA